ncbi:hypothetical protein VTI74DRAFT_6327 [Chaetomium olivicolor]
MNAPRPSQICLLSTLPSKQIGDKVRFLGCVRCYSQASGVLILEHRLPEETCPVHALVDVTLVLERLSSDQTRAGEWVNVIGYITHPSSLFDEKAQNGNLSVHVQAILLWSAGPVDLRRYEASLKALAQAPNSVEC